MHLRNQSEDTPKYENIRNIPFKIRNKIKMSTMTTSIHNTQKAFANATTENRLQRKR